MARQKQSKNDSNSLTKIMQSARQLFAAHGFDGTAMSDIARLAEVNKSLIYHYFPTKQELWRQCKNATLESTIKPKFILPIDQGLTAFLEAVIHSRYQLYKQNPEMMRMIAWQSLSENSEVLNESSALNAVEWVSAIKKLQKSGDINPKLKPKFIVTLLISAMLPVTTYYLQAILKSATERESYVKYLIDHFSECLAKKP
jgi:AcrR family transcriptional regulator